MPREDETTAAFGVFPQMKARRAKQDREAAANAPLSALRGWAAGTAGLPGDIEGLARMAMSQVPSQFLNAMPALRAFGIGSRANPTPQLPTTEFYNEYLPGAQLNQTPTGKAFTTAGNVLGGTGSTNIAGLGAKGTAELANLAARIAAESPRAGSRAAQLGVIKMPGGNFLKGGIEDAVSPMKRGVVNEEAARRLMGDAFTNERMADPVNNALNTFIDKKIVPYIKNEMATPGDPLRAMAEKYAVDKPAKLAEVQGRIDAFAAKMEQTARERGVPVGDLTSMRQQMIGLEKEKALVEAREGLHFTPDEEQYSRYIQNRKAAGTDMSGMGQSPLAKSWENVSDSAIGIDDAGYLLNPREQGRIMISERLESNPWLAKVPPETKVYNVRSMLPERTGFDHLVDELRNATNPESGLPKNLLIDPADLSKLTMPKAVELVADINAWRATQKAEADLLRANNAATQVVKEYPEQGMKWVELKAPEMQEGWVPPERYEIRKPTPSAESLAIFDKEKGQYVTSGLASEEQAIKHLYQMNTKQSLEDALKYEGDTMQHCVGGYCPDVVEGRSRIYSLRDAKGQPRVTIEVAPWRSSQGESLSEFEARLRADPNRPEEAVRQIMSTPQYADKILQIKGFKNQKPADEFLPFVQDFVKSGQWSDVGDLRNAGLHDARAAGKAIEGRPAFMTDEELKVFQAEFAPKPEGMAKGGLVSNHFDPIKIKQIIASLDDDYDPQRIQQIIAHQESSYA